MESILSIASRTTTSLFLLSALLLVAAGGCTVDGTGPASPEAPTETTGRAESEDRIAPFDDPSGLLGVVSRRLKDNIVEADIGQTFGVEDANVPFPDTYWPMSSNGIDRQWNQTAPSPLEKYMTLADAPHMTQAKDWNRRYAGVDVPNLKSWNGICQGWVAASILEKPVLHAVSAKMVSGRVLPCTAGEAGCMTFEIGDINALLATTHADARARFIGGRCDTAPAEIKRDASGRIERTGNGTGCKGLNAGSLLIVLNHRLKQAKKAMAIDAQNAWNTNEIWNQPAYRYTVNRYEPLTMVEAANLVATGQRTGALTSYTWNADAKGFVYVDVTVHWVTERGPNLTVVSGLSSTSTTRMTAVIELDKASTEPTADIIGGELTEDSTVGSNRLHNHPFVWIPVAPGPGYPWNTGSGHNPFVRSQIVDQLAALGQQ